MALFLVGVSQLTGNGLLEVGFGLPLTGLDGGIPSMLVELKPTGAPWLTGAPQGPEGSGVCIG